MREKINDSEALAYTLCFLELTNEEQPNKEWLEKGFKIYESLLEDEDEVPNVTPKLPEETEQSEKRGI